MAYVRGPFASTNAFAGRGATYLSLLERDLLLAFDRLSERRRLVRRLRRTSEVVVVIAAWVAASLLARRALRNRATSNAARVMHV